MLKTVKIYTCDICGKKVTVEEHDLPENILNRMELEETFLGQAHTTTWDHVCKECVIKIKQTIKELEKVEHE